MRFCLMEEGMNAWKQGLMATALLMAASAPAMAEDFGDKISGAFTSAYHGLRDGMIGAYEDGTEGAKDAWGNAKAKINGQAQPAPVASAPTGARDDLVYQVQNELNTRGYVAGTPDGRYGPQTANAVRAYQTNNGLAPDGLVTMALLDHMRANRTAAVAPQPAPYGQPAPVQPVQPEPITPPPAGYVAPAPSMPPAVAPAQPSDATPPAAPGLPALPKQG